MKSEAQIRRAARELRAIVDDTERDEAEPRVAYAMECALRWALGLAGNYRVADDAQMIAGFMKRHYGIADQSTVSHED